MARWGKGCPGVALCVCVSSPTSACAQPPQNKHGTNTIKVSKLFHLQHSSQAKIEAKHCCK